ncbi:type VI secretion system Vgr family protein [Billgrantia sp. Q4P2]|uniref:type VI secretion system Vgr family protein n=1 Tax=Billgrantia sp. Q4P2 TaxID=3463857 RepID=UPI0040560387
MAGSHGLAFTLERDGAEGLDLAVVTFTLEEELSQPFELSVSFASRDGGMTAKDWLDVNATLTVWQDGEPVRRVTGAVARFARGDTGHRRTHYEVVIRPALWRLKLRHNSRIFENAPPLSVIQTLCEEHGITDVAFAIRREPQVREYLTQFREHDLTFLQRLAAEEGIFFYFEAAEGSSRAVFADDAQLLPNLGSKTYHARAGGSLADARYLYHLRQESSVAPAAAVLQDYSFKKPDYAQLHEHHADGLESHAQRGVVDNNGYEHYDFPGRFKADASGEAFTRVRLEYLRRDAYLAKAESNLPELSPGHRFTLADHDVDEYNTEWQVVSIRHEGHQPQAVQEDAVAAAEGGDATRLTNKLSMMPASRTWRPKPTTRPRVDGPQVATVVGPEGEEIHTDEFGRVRVVFPWNREGTASAWLRVAQGWAGAGYGMFALPRIGHEVAVAFWDADPDQPYVSGSAYHAVNTPPYALPEHKTRTVIRTKSHQDEGFNEIRLDDRTGDEEIWIHAQKNLNFLTLNDRREVVQHDSHLKVENDRLGEITGNDHLTVRGQQYRQIDGDDHARIGGSAHRRYGDALLAEAGQHIHVKAGDSVVIDAGASISLAAGGSFITLSPSGVAISGPSIKLNSGGSPGRGAGQAAQAALLPGHVTPESPEWPSVPEHRLEQAAALRSPIIEMCQKPTDGSPCPLGQSCPCEEG